MHINPPSQQRDAYPTPRLPAHSTMAAIAQSPITRPSRAPLIRQLQWASMDSSTVIFAISTFSMSRHQLFLPRTIAVITAAFELALLWMDRRNQSLLTSMENGTPSPGTDTATLAQEESQTTSPMASLPVACRKWAIGLRTLLVLGWAMAMASVIVGQVLTPIPSAYAIFSIIWSAVQLAVVGALDVVCFLEQQGAVRI